MPASGPNYPVESPRLAPPVSGLLSQVPVVTDSALLDQAKRWLGGVVLRPEDVKAPEAADMCVTLGLADDHTGTPLRVYKPFSVVMHDQCSTFGWTEADYIGRATRALDVKRHYIVEHEFETGALIAANPHLAQTFAAPPDPTSTVLLAGSARVSPKDALCLLDEAIAYSAAMIGRGIIHATPFLIGRWMAEGHLLIETVKDSTVAWTDAAAKALGALSFDPEALPGLAALAPLAAVLAGSVGASGGRQYWSPKGNLVVAGNGYKGYDTTGALDGTHASQWAYATDPIAVLASAPVTTPGTLNEAVDHHRNLVTYRQDQEFAVLWPGLLHAAVQVATSTPAVP